VEEVAEAGDEEGDGDVVEAKFEATTDGKRVMIGMIDAEVVRGAASEAAREAAEEEARRGAEKDHHENIEKAHREVGIRSIEGAGSVRFQFRPDLPPKAIPVK